MRGMLKASGRRDETKAIEQAVRRLVRLHQNVSALDQADRSQIRFNKFCGRIKDLRARGECYSLCR
jgi:hypothetical protein